MSARLSQFALTLILLGSSGCGRPAPADWTATEVDYEYSFEMPGKPELKRSLKHSPFGDVMVRIYAFSPDKGPGGFAFSTFALPPGRAEPSNGLVKTFFDDMQRGALKAAGGTVLQSQDISFGGRPGRDLLVRAPNMEIHRIRYLLVGRTVLWLAALGTDPGEAERFFNSLRVLREPDPPPRWKTTEIRGQYAFDMPGEPKITTERFKGPRGNVDLKIYRVATNGITWGYLFSVVDITAEPPDLRSSAVGRVFDLQQKEVLDRTHARLVQSRKIVYDGHQGREIVAVREDEVTIRFRLIADEQACIIMEARGVELIDSIHFFNSLRILESAERAKPPAGNGK